ncbi:kunitz-type protease inhibitor 1-like [Neosynchiropus ocellatus]
MNLCFFSSLLLLRLLPRVRAAEDAACRLEFQAGQQDFVLDLADAVDGGALLLSTAHASTAAACEAACCADPRCNLALLEPPGAAAGVEGGGRSCLLFDCVRNNLFVCRFVNEAGYQSFIRTSVFKKHLEGPSGEPRKSTSPPIAIAGRDVVVRPGVTVTLNGIESLALGSAHITDYSWRLHSGNSSVDLQKTNLQDQIQVSELQPGAYQFQLTVTDSNQRTGSALVSVLVLSPEMTRKYCLAPAKVGPCRAAFGRWRYDAEKGACELFVFGGCKQNHNNYLSEKECLSACSGVTGNALAHTRLVLMSQPLSLSLCGPEVCGSVCRPDQLACQGSCCLDRWMECDGVRQCANGADEERCGQLNRTFTRLLKVNVNVKKARCVEPPRTGPCRASFPRWYYDPLNTACQRFTYGGCDQNDNNFEDETTCKDACSGVTERNVFAPGMFERYEDPQGSDSGMLRPRHDTRLAENSMPVSSGSIALAVVLAVSILALLAVLTYCFLKSRRERSRQQAAVSLARTGPSEQDDLVYNRTTKPV